MIKKFGDRNCSVGATLEILGDRWIFLILREAFFRVRYYHQFRDNLGIATNILSDRLKTLVTNGILKKDKDINDHRRSVYLLTEKGLDLYQIMLAFMQWGDRWLAQGEPPIVLMHMPCGHTLAPVMVCAHCNKPVDAGEVAPSAPPLK